jgi:hypothetical protein
LTSHPSLETKAAPDPRTLPAEPLNPLPGGMETGELSEDEEPFKNVNVELTSNYLIELHNIVILFLHHATCFDKLNANKSAREFWSR